MKLFIVLACLTVAWAVPFTKENQNVQELEVIPDDDSIDSSDVESAAYLPQIIEVGNVLMEYERANAKSIEDTQNVPEIEPLNGPEVNANFLEDDSADELPDVANLMPLNENDQDAIQIAAPFDNDVDEKSGFDEIQIVNLDDFRGIMDIAPSELDSLRVYFDDDMAAELADGKEAPEIVRLNYDDPNLR
ncbi:uncharacterized protein LOC123716217 [Pieris brassicae]|uniref:Uncharacterized protein n=1 Tax=Pieris brassicae TaxID=7116 RepID=A0A9P0XBX6_PIEBR|nr:uncharacterized protein LOC123716217 [Pieris brassicae]CAH4029139.1 unnamed protein product [Pieris brassicae]